MGRAVRVLRPYVGAATEIAALLLFGYAVLIIGALLMGDSGVLQ